MADALPTMDELDRMCRDQTGRTLQQWDQLHTKRRRRDLRKGIIRSDRPLQLHEVHSWMAMYGFQPTEFVAKQISCDAARNFHPKFKTPRDSRTGNLAHNVIRWFLKPDIIPA